MIKIKYKSRDSLLIVAGIFCLITSCCESIFVEKDSFKLTPLEPLSDEIPYEELGSGKILFCRNNFSDGSGFYVIDVDKRNSYGFTSNSEMHYPYVSPDGSKIAYKLSLSDRNFTYGICCMNIDGTNCISVTDSGGGYCPTWSPDGLKILYYTNSIDGLLYMLSAIENASDRVEIIKFYYGDDPDWFIGPYGGFSMSPDGQLVCASKGGAKTSGILKIEPNSGKSPDGTKIAFAIHEIDTLEDQGFIWIKSMDPDGTNHTPLARVKISNGVIYSLYPRFLSRISLCWSPDSKKILFNGPDEQNDGFHLMLVNADGSGLIRVTDKMNVDDLYVSWGR